MRVQAAERIVACTHSQESMSKGCGIDSWQAAHERRGLAEERVVVWDGTCEGDKSGVEGRSTGNGGRRRVWKEEKGGEEREGRRNRG